MSGSQQKSLRRGRSLNYRLCKYAVTKGDDSKKCSILKKETGMASVNHKKQSVSNPALLSGAMDPSYSQTNASCKPVDYLKSDTLMSGQEAGRSNDGNESKKKRGRKPDSLNRKPIEKLTVPSDSQRTLSGQEAGSSSIGNIPEKKKSGRKPGTLNRKTLEKLAALTYNHHTVSSQDAGSSSSGYKPEKKRGRKPGSLSRKTLEKLAALSDTHTTVSGQDAGSSSIGCKPEKKQRGRKPGSLSRKTLEKLAALSDTHTTVSGQDAGSSSIGCKPEKNQRGRKPGSLSRKTLEKLAALSDTHPTVSGQDAGSSSIGYKPEKKSGRKPGSLSRKTLEKLAALSDTLPTVSGQDAGSSSIGYKAEKKKRGRKPGSLSRKTLEKPAALSGTRPTASGQETGRASFERQPEKKTRGRRAKTLNSKSLEKCKVIESEIVKKHATVGDPVLTRLRKQRWVICFCNGRKKPEKNKIGRTTCECELSERANEQDAVDNALSTGMSEQGQVLSLKSDSEEPEEKRARRTRKKTRTAVETCTVCIMGKRMVAVCDSGADTIKQEQVVENRSDKKENVKKRGRTPKSLNRKKLETLKGITPHQVKGKGSICPYSSVTVKEIPNVVQTTENTQVRMSICALASKLKDKQILIEEQREQNGVKTCSSTTCRSPGLPNPAVMLQKCDSVLKKLASAKKLSEPQSVMTVNESNLVQLVSPGDIAARRNTQVFALKNNGLEISVHQKRQIQRKRLIRENIDFEKRPRKVTLHRSGADSSGSNSNKSGNAAERNKYLQCNMPHIENEDFCDGILQEEFNNTILMDEGLQQNTFEGYGLFSFWGSWRTPAYLLSEEEYSDNSLSVMHSPLSPCSQLPEVMDKNISCQRVEPFTGKNVWKCSCARTSIWTFSRKRPDDNKNTEINTDDQSAHWRTENDIENLSKKRKLDLLLDGLPLLDFNPMVPDLEGHNSSSFCELKGDDPSGSREADESTSESFLHEPNNKVVIKKEDHNQHISNTSSKALTVPKLSQMTKIIKPPAFKLPLTCGVEKKPNLDCGSLLNVKETINMSYHSPPILDYFDKVLPIKTCSSPPFFPVFTDHISHSKFDVRDQTVDTIHLSVDDIYLENGASNGSTANLSNLCCSKDDTLQYIDAGDSDSELEPSPEKKHAMNNTTPNALNDAALEAINDVAPNALNDAASDALNDAASDALNDAAPEAINDIAPNALNDSSPDALNDAPPKVINYIAPNALNDAASDALNDAAPEAINDIAPDALNDAPPEAINDIAPNALNDAFPDALNDAASDALNDAPPKAISDIAPNALNDAASDALNDAAPEAINDVAPNALNNAAPYALNNAPKAINDAAPDALNDAAPDALNDAAPDALNDAAPEAVNDAAPDALNNAAPKAINYIAPDALNDASPDALNDIAPNVLNGAAPDALEGAAPDALEGAALEGAAPDALEGAAPDALEGAAPDALEADALEGAAPDALEGAAPDALEGAAPDALEGAAPDALENAATDALENAATNALHDATDALPDAAIHVDALSDGSPDALSDGSPDALSDGSPDALSDGSPDALSDGSPDALSDGSPDALSGDTPDVLKAYEDDVLVIDVIPDDPDLFGCFNVKGKSPEFCNHIAESRGTANQKPRNISLVRNIPQEKVSSEHDRSDSPMEIDTLQGTPVMDSFLFRQHQIVSGSKPDWTGALNPFPEGSESSLHLIEVEEQSPPELPNQGTSELMNETEILSGGGEHSSFFEESLLNNPIPGLPHSYFTLQTESVLNENHPQWMHGHGQEVPLLDVMNPDSWENCRRENNLAHKPLQHFKVPYGYCKYFFTSVYGCCKAQCLYLHVPKQSDEKLCMDLLHRMISENRTSFLQRAFLVFNEYYSKYLPRINYDEGVFNALLDQLLKLSWWQEVLHLLETATSTNVLPSIENIIKVFEHVASSHVQVAVPSLMGIFSKCLDGGMTPTLREINHIIAIVNQLPNSRMPINFLLTVKSKIEAHLPKKSLVHDLEAAMIEIEHCKVNSDWVKLGTLYVNMCTGRDNLTDLKTFSRCIAEALMKESVDDRPDVPYCEFADTIFKHPHLNEVHKTIVGRIGISITFFYYRKELWQKGRRVLFKLHELKINYKALKGITGQEIFASRCAVINVAVEIFLMCGRINSAVQTLRECDWIIHSATWPCDKMDVLKRHSLLCAIVQEALSKSMYTMCFEVLQNLPGFKESQAEFNLSQYDGLFNKVLNSAVSNRSLNISSLIVDFMVLRKIPIDYLNLRELITALGHSSLWHKARDYYKCALSLGFYPVLDGHMNNTILYIPSFMSAIEMLLTMEGFIVSNARIQLPGGCNQNLQIILRKIFREEESSKGKDLYHAASERLLEASRLSSPRLFTKYLTVNNSGEQVYSLDHNCCVKWLNENLNWAMKIWGFH